MMIEFLKDSDINNRIENLFADARKHLVLFSPYIKLHDRLKSNLLLQKENYKLELIVVFGKNEENYQKSLNKTEFDFLCQLPNVEIKYNSRLHAKYYENDSSMILSSMNLYEHSHNNNIEFGIFISKNSLGKLVDVVVDTRDYFVGVYENSETLYKRTPQYEKSLGGLKSTYTHSIVEVDKLSKVYEPKANTFTPEFHKEQQQSKIHFMSMTKLSTSLGIDKKELDSLFEQKAWIVKEGKTWELTDEGTKVGGVIKKWQKGEYIAFPESIKEKINLQQ